MRRDGNVAIFWLTAAAAAASLISIVAMEILMGTAILLWIFKGSEPLRWPSYFLPLGVFFLTTLLSLVFSPDPAGGLHPVQKMVLFPMGLLATAFVNSEARARQAIKLLLGA